MKEMTFTLRNLPLALMAGAMMIGPALAGQIAQERLHEQRVLACRDYLMAVGALDAFAIDGYDEDDMIALASEHEPGISQLTADEAKKLATNVRAYVRAHPSEGRIFADIYGDCVAGRLDFIDNIAP
jgi:hypothetical protein